MHSAGGVVSNSYIQFIIHILMRERGRVLYLKEVEKKSKEIITNFN